jgi:DNA replication protein DnaC
LACKLRRREAPRTLPGRETATKSLDSFDFKAIPKLNKMLVLELARCDWIDRREIVIALGPSGTGMTHVALGLWGWPPARRGFRSASLRPPRWSTS